MKFVYIFFYGMAVITSAVGIAACDSTGSVVNTNANVSNVRANSNTAVLVNANSNVANTNRAANSNITREEYDRNRAEYEKDRGDDKIGTGANDGWIWFKTKTALATTDDLRDSTINVDVENERITLRGTVASAAEKSRAEEVAKSIDGQKGVTNRLTVKASDSMTNQMVNGNSASSNSDR